VHEQRLDSTQPRGPGGRTTAAKSVSGRRSAPAAGHASFSTTQRYIDLAGVVFRDEAERLDRHLFGERSGKSPGKSAADAPGDADDER
jgi:hypothetical protein